jgi:GxxExxY protein
VTAVSDHAVMRTVDLIERETTHAIIGAFYDVYNELGFGFLEHVYMLALERELVARGHKVRREVWVEIHYKGELLAEYRVDMIVDEKVMVEGKSTFALPYTAKRQTRNYLRASTLEVALLLHFGPYAKFYRFVSSSLL